MRAVPPTTRMARMDLGLGGKVAVVTGASKGIGLAIVQALVAEGASVVAGARGTTAELAELAAAGRCGPVAVDLAPPAARSAGRRGGGRDGGLDILVNNVGAVKPRLGGFLAVTDEDWLGSLNLNLLSAVRTTRAALPRLLAAVRAAS